MSSKPNTACVLSARTKFGVGTYLEFEIFKKIKYNFSVSFNEGTVQWEGGSNSKLVQLKRKYGKDGREVKATPFVFSDFEVSFVEGDGPLDIDHGDITIVFDQYRIYRMFLFMSTEDRNPCDLVKDVSGHMAALFEAADVDVQAMSVDDEKFHKTVERAKRMSVFVTRENVFSLTEKS